jgi:hypothetical protein
MPGVTSTGNVIASGTLTVSGNVDINTDKFNIVAASGNTTIGGTLSVGGALAMNANAITGVADPTNAQDVATKAYVDANGGAVADGGITTAKLADDGVTAAKIATGAVLADALGVTAGTAEASKALVLDASSNISGIAALTTSGLASLDGGIDVNGSNFTVSTSGAVVASEITSSNLTAAAAADLNLTAGAGNQTIYLAPTGTGTVDVSSTTITSANGVTGPATTDLTLTAGSGNQSVVLVPTGTGTIDASSFKITNVVDPTSDQDAATKAYVDANAGISGLTASAAELNFLDGALAETVVNSKAVIYGNAGEIEASILNVSGLSSLDGGIDVGDDFSIDTNGAIQSDRTSYFRSGFYVGSSNQCQINFVGQISTSQSISGGALNATGLASLDGGIDVNSSNFTVDTSGNTAVGGNLTVAGNLTVSGTTTTVNTDSLNVQDNIIVANSGGSVDLPSGFAVNAQANSNAMTGTVKTTATSDGTVLTIAVSEWYVPTDAGNTTASADPGADSLIGMVLEFGSGTTTAGLRGKTFLIADNTAVSSGDFTITLTDDGDGTLDSNDAVDGDTFSVHPITIEPFSITSSADTTSVTIPQSASTYGGSGGTPPANYYDGWWLEVNYDTTAANIGHVSRISSSTTTPVLTLATALSAALDNTAVVTLYPSNYAGALYVPSKNRIDFASFGSDTGVVASSTDHTIDARMRSCIVFDGARDSAGSDYDKGSLFFGADPLDPQDDDFRVRVIDDGGTKKLRFERYDTGAWNTLQDMYSA